MEIRLGKIETVFFGHGGYQDGMIGLHFTFSGGSCGVSWSEDAWDSEMVKWSENCEWTEESRDKQHSDIVRKLSLYLKQEDIYTII